MSNRLRSLLCFEENLFEARLRGKRLNLMELFTNEQILQERMGKALSPEKNQKLHEGKHSCQFAKLKVVASNMEEEEVVE